MNTYERDCTMILSMASEHEYLAIKLWNAIFTDNNRDSETNIR